ncbi:MAG: hypothetical protein WCK58_02845 [Chloroflexota bacterium]
MRPARDLTILAALLVTLSACGGSGATPVPTQSAAATLAPEGTDDAAATTPADEPTEAAAGGTFDACTLLTIDEVKQITGAVTTAGPEGTDLADWVAGSCWWSSSDMKVRFSLDYGDKASIAKSSSPSVQDQFDVTKAVYVAMANATDLAGVGDKAIAWDGGAYAIKGDKAILLTAIFNTRDEAITILKAAIAKI